MDTKTLLQSLLHVAWCLEPFECYMHLNILFHEDFLMLQCYNKRFLEFMLFILISGINLSNPPLRLGSCLCKAPAVVLGLGKLNLAFCILHGPSLWQVLSKERTSTDHIEGYNLLKGGISYIPWCFAANFCLLFSVERAFEGFEGDFQWAEFQDGAHPR